MSTDSITAERILFADLFDGRLKRFGVREHINELTSDTSRCLTDGRNYLWAYTVRNGTLSGLVRYAGNASSRILEAIADTFDTDIFSEYEPQYWGFDNQEQWDQAMDELGKESEAEFHADLIKYLMGEKNDLRPGTNGMIMANIAKRLAAENPELVSPDKKTELMDMIWQIYKTEHAVVINLDSEIIAAARMAMTHEDDLPQA